MSRPRFLADQDLIAHIVTGVLRREPLVDFIRCLDVGLDNRSDDEVLAFAAANQLIVVSHDVKTMEAAAYGRVALHQTMTGLFLARQRNPIGPVIDDLVLIWSASEPEEWHGQVRYLPL